MSFVVSSSQSELVNIDLKESSASCEFYWEACLSRSGARHLEQLEKSYLKERAVCGLLLSTDPQTCDTRHIGEYPVPFISVKKRVDDCLSPSRV